ncbi:OmpA domain-containing protein [Yersinia thracica]|uniref:OmpA domain-containing protein n=1 Tax=Yersinia thracica TaxID=2890319 RepID=A0A0T9NGE6_9GAMM|nr:DotU family type VI secretion system protein [Yersinia thracica]CNH06522.1 OmpA domain-containing protein [Yersinia thracica]
MTQEKTQLDPESNPLVLAARPLLNIIAKIRQSATHNDPIQLRQHLIDEIRRFELRCQLANQPYEMIIGARYCLCTSLDEAAALMPAWGDDNIWSGNGLLVTFHNETFGGDKFFDLLTRLSQNPHKYIDLLELLNYCLLLGFKGRYKVMDNGHSLLETMKQRLQQRTRLVRGNYSARLSPDAQILAVQQKRWKPRMSLWASASLTAFLVSLLFIVLSWKLNNATRPVLAAIYQIALPQWLTPSPISAVSPVFNLAGFLQEEIASGLVVVRTDANKSVIVLRGDGLFDPGMTTIRPAYDQVINRIGKALSKVSGMILVTGYSDNVPIRKSRFTSNVALSLGRANEVGTQLQKHLDNSQRVKTEGRGEANPIAPNDNKESRALNRRVEITLLVPPGNTQTEVNKLQ